MNLVPFMPPPGINSDDTTFSAEGRWADADGFRFVQGKPQTIQAHSLLDPSATAQAVTKLFAYTISGDPAIASAGTALKHVSATSGAQTTITPAAGWTSGQFCFAMWGDILLALCSAGKLFESSAGAQATEVTNSPNQSIAMIVTPSRQVMVLGTKEEGSGTFNSRCIRWSDIEDRNDWTTAVSGNAGEYILPGQSGIVSATIFGDYILIWTETSLWLGSYIGDPGETFRFTLIDSGCGLLGLDSFAVLSGVAYWISPSLEFFSYSLGGAVSPLPCPIRRDFRDNEQRNIPNLTFGCAVQARNEIWFGYDDARDVGSEPGRYLIYCAGESAAAQAPVWSRGTWAGLLPNQTAAGAMIDFPFLWAEEEFAGPIVAAYSSSSSVGLYYANSGTNGPVTAYIQSADWYLDESQRRMMVRSFVPDFEYQGGTVTLTVSMRDRPHSTASSSTYSVTTSNTKKDFRKSGMIAAVKFAPATGTRLRLGKPLFDMTPMGER